MQRPWGKNMFGMFKEQQGGQFGWREMSEGVTSRRLTSRKQQVSSHKGQVGHYKDFDFYA